MFGRFVFRYLGKVFTLQVLRRHWILSFSGEQGDIAIIVTVCLWYVTQMVWFQWNSTPPPHRVSTPLIHGWITFNCRIGNPPVLSHYDVTGWGIYYAVCRIYGLNAERLNVDFKQKHGQSDLRLEWIAAQYGSTVTRTMWFPPGPNSLCWI